MVTGRNAAARELGITPRALGKAFVTGRVSKTPEGLYDVDACREALNRNTNPIKQASARAQQKQNRVAVDTAAMPASHVPPQSDPKARTEDLGESVFDAAPPPPGSMLAIQIQRERFKLKVEIQKFRQANRRLVDGRKVKSELIERAANEKQALLNWPKRISASLAAELGVDERQLFDALNVRMRTFLLERSSVPIEAPFRPAADTVPEAMSA